MLTRNPQTSEKGNCAMSKDVSSRKSCDAEIGRVGARVQQGDRGQLGGGYGAPPKIDLTS